MPRVVSQRTQRLRNDVRRSVRPKADNHAQLHEDVLEILAEDEYEYPQLLISDELTFGEGIDKFLDSCGKTIDFRVEGYESHPPIKGELSN